MIKRNSLNEVRIIEVNTENEQLIGAVDALLAQFGYYLTDENQYSDRRSFSFTRE